MNEVMVDRKLASYAEEMIYAWETHNWIETSKLVGFWKLASNTEFVGIGVEILLKYLSKKMTTTGLDDEELSLSIDVVKLVEEGDERSSKYI
jgi:hypothetical protein